MLGKDDMTMENILQILCDTCFELPEGFYKQDFIVEQQEKMNNLTEKLKGTLNEDEKNLLNHLIDEVNQFCFNECYEYFKQGICCGVQLYDEIKEADAGNKFTKNLEPK